MSIIRINNCLFFASIIISGLCLASCDVDDEQNIEPSIFNNLIFDDDFNGSEGESIDQSIWNYDIGRGDNGWGNAEIQYYTDRTENIAKDGQGNLVITSIAESFSGAAYTSARINTKDKLSFQYGRIEARIKLPAGRGVWPAFWMLGSNIDEVGWPNCGEIDILEMRGQAPSIVIGSVHGPGYSAGSSISGEYSLINDRFDNEFHVYAIEWRENQIDYLVDGFLYQRITPEDVTGDWVFNSEFFLLMNVAVGGTFIGFPSPLTPFPQTMTIDYIRVYQ